VVAAVETAAAAPAFDASRQTSGHESVIHDFDFHPGEPHVRIFSTPRSGVLRWDECAVVVEGLYGDVVLRHYAFRKEWFKVNVTTDRVGRIVETPTTSNAPAFAFNCDVATPMIQDGDTVLAVDLFADVLVRADGTTFETVDQADFDAALSNGLISASEHRHGTEGLARLMELIQGNVLIPFLTEVCPFGPSSAWPAPPMTLVPLAGVPLLQPGLRSTW